MNWDQLEGKWQQVKGRVKEEWGDLTDNALHQAAGKRDRLSGMTQERYGLEKEEAARDLDHSRGGCDRPRLPNYVGPRLFGLPPRGRTAPSCTPSGGEPMLRLLIYPIALLSGFSVALAEQPVSVPTTLDAETIISRTHAALDPAPPSIRKWEIRASIPPGLVPSVVHVAQARKETAGGDRTLTVVTAPAALRGTAFMLAEDDQARWMYVPTIERVRKILPVLQGEAFLHTDFTYGDLGFIDRRSTHRLIGKGTRLGLTAYQVEEVPALPWYYSRIWTWIAADTFLPLQREFYDPAGALWKVETFDMVERIEGHPTPLRIRMEDVQTKTSTEIRVSDVQYKVDLPDALFDPERLSQAIASPAFEAHARLDNTRKDD